MAPAAPVIGADLGLRGGRIAAIGDLSAGEAANTVDAAGKVVCPGFVDVHTHLDAQVFWDTTLSPSPLHGVTSVIGGNCGFTIAPLTDDPADGEYLMQMLARVEGMPLKSLQVGVPWNWRSTAEYFDAFDGTLSINTAFKVGHSALRRVVMGPDCVKREATPEELAQMQDLLRAGLEAGALGFSSSYARTHNDPFGNMVPSRYASRHELVELARVCSEFEGTSLELIPCVGPFDDAAITLMTNMSVAAQDPAQLECDDRGRGQPGRVLRQAGGQRSRQGQWRQSRCPHPFRWPSRFGSAWPAGLCSTPCPTGRGPCSLLRRRRWRFWPTRPSATAWPSWPASPAPFRAWPTGPPRSSSTRSPPRTSSTRGAPWARSPRAEGKKPFDALCDIVLTDELKTSFGTPPPVSSDEDWKARMEIWRDGRAVIGASDAGAHLDLFMTANYTTSMLGQCMRERGLISTEEAVHLMTDVQAKLYGLRERGQLQEGWHGDVVVLDESRVGARPLTTVADLPAGAPRLYGEADGIDHVFCNGEEIVRDGQFTDARPGKHLRSGSDTERVDLA